MFSSFSTALAALRANATGVDVVGHNLANLNTTGFKKNVVTFHDLMAESVRQFGQGMVQPTGGTLDAAIEGGGFFIVRDEQNRMLFTRAGNFRVDAAGNLLTATGQKVQGWSVSNGIVNTGTAISNILIPQTTPQPPQVTSRVALDLNLNAAGVKGQPSGSFSTPIEVVDSLGVTHVLTFTFTKSGANQWDYAVSIPGEDVSGGTPGTPSPIAGASGSLQFDAQGQLTSPAAASGTVALQISGLTSGAADLKVNWELYTAGGKSRLTQFASPSAVSSNEQDGRKGGIITKVALTDGGQVVAQYSNGQKLVLAQLALASIVNPDTLVDAGNNNLEAAPETATPAIGLPETGGRGKIHGASLETSTVDIAQEFTNLILLQRSYQANARMITASDELSQETINLIR